MIKIRGAKDYLIALESVAMTDIVLNMFIFFFISFSLIYTFSQGSKVSKIEVKLPKASSAIALEGSEKTILTITKLGEYYINDEKIRSRDLKDMLESKAKEDPEINVLMKVDNSARFDSVVRALDVMNELNIQHVSVASNKKEE